MAKEPDIKTKMLMESYKKGKAVEELTCPQCNHELAYFSGLESIPAHLYCPMCLNLAFNEEGEIIFELY